MVFRAELLSSNWQARFQTMADLKFSRIYPLRDPENRRIIVLEPSHLENVHVPRTNIKEDLDKALLYTLLFLQSVANEPLVILFVHEKLPGFSARYLAWLDKLHKILPKQCRNNIQKIVILTPPKRLRQIHFFLRPFKSKEFWKKVGYAHSISQAETILGVQNIAVGDFSSLNIFNSNTSHTQSSDQLDKKLLSNFLDPKFDNDEEVFYSFNSSFSSSSRDSSKRLNIVFGSPLDQYLAVEAIYPVPKVIVDCAEFILANEIVPGVFRIPGDADRIAILKSSYNKGETPQLSCNGKCQPSDIHAAASLLKSYFRDLPQPVVSYQVFAQALEKASDEGLDSATLAYQLGDILIGMQRNNFNTLGYIIHFLSMVAENCEVNLMGSKNLAIVWAPNIFRSSDSDPVSLLMELPRSVKITNCLIAHAHIVFPPEMIEMMPAASYIY